jgi:hypothetical protein
MNKAADLLAAIPRAAELTRPSKYQLRPRRRSVPPARCLLIAAREPKRLTDGSRTPSAKRSARPQVAMIKCLRRLLLPTLVLSFSFSFAAGAPETDS